MEYISKRIGQRINSSLAGANKLQKDLAKHLGVTDNTVSYYCNGTRIPSTLQIIEISKFLNVSADYLLGLPDKGISETNIKLHACDDLGISSKAYEKIKAIFKSSNDDMKDICSEMINMISRKIEDNSNGKL